MKKATEKRLILYRKYLHDNHLDTEHGKDVSVKKPKSRVKSMMDVLIVLIIFAMTILSCVGVITLLDEQLRKMFMDAIGICR